jgi:ethanolamine utilization microcompartment shell protein EutS
MSIHAIPSPTSDLTDSIRWQRAVELQRLALGYLGKEPTITDNGTTLSLVFTPDLTAPQTATLNRLIALSGLLRITPAEWATIEADLVTARAYVNIATPTLVQTAAATKSVIRFLRVLVRD